MALALIGDPELLFLDEPTTGFDPSARRAAWDVISGLRALGKTIFLTTHYMEEAEHLADRIAVIAKGQIVAEGDAAGIGERATKASTIRFTLPPGLSVADLPPTITSALVARHGWHGGSKGRQPTGARRRPRRMGERAPHRSSRLGGHPAHPRGHLPRTDRSSGHDRHNAHHRAFPLRLRAARRCTSSVPTFAAFLRNKQSVFFTIALPVLFLVIFASVFKHQNVAVPGGRVDESVYYVPGIIAYGLIAATFSNIVVSVVRYREAGIYKRRRATPVPASAIIAGRALVAALTALVLTAVLLAIGWAGFGAHIPGRTGPAFFLDVVVGAVVFCCLGFAVASVVKNAGRGTTRRPGYHPAALLHLRRLHPDPGAASLARRRGQGLPGACSRGCPPCRLQPAHRRERARLGRPRRTCRMGRRCSCFRDSPLQLDATRHAEAFTMSRPIGVRPPERARSLDRAPSEAVGRDVMGDLLR